MGFLSIFGKIIIGLSAIGFVITIFEAISRQNGLLGLAAIASLLGGIYIGYLGIAVNEVHSGSFPMLHANDDTTQLSERVARLEEALNLKTNHRKGNPPAENLRLAIKTCPNCNQPLTFLARQNNLCDFCGKEIIPGSTT